MKTVLVVDDSTFMRKIIKNAVTKHEFDVIGEAVNGDAAVKLYLELKPDIVTMDITMSGMGGIEATKQIYETDANAKILVVSSMGQELIVKDAIKSGAKGFIVKPFQEDQLIEALKKL